MSNCHAFDIWDFVDGTNEVILPQICHAFVFQMNVAQSNVSIDCIMADDISPQSKVNTEDVWKMWSS